MARDRDAQVGNVLLAQARRNRSHCLAGIDRPLRRVVEPLPYGAVAHSLFQHTRRIDAGPATYGRRNTEVRESLEVGRGAGDEVAYQFPSARSERLKGEDPMLRASELYAERVHRLLEIDVALLRWLGLPIELEVDHLGELRVGARIGGGEGLAKRQVSRRRLVCVLNDRRGAFGRVVLEHFATAVRHT